MLSLGGKLRRLDVYQKVDEKVLKGTNIGGAISIITSLMILIFLFYELQRYIHPDLKTSIQDNDYFTRKEMMYFC